MRTVFHIFSERGDEYRLCLSSEDGHNLSKEIREDFGLEVISIELTRINGIGITSIRTLAAIEQAIAETYYPIDDAILFYYCDFLNAVPATRKAITPQEYRSRLFSLMFHRYILHHNIQGVSEMVIEINGLDEPYFFHIICRDRHLDAVKQISDKLQNDFKK